MRLGMIPIHPTILPSIRKREGCGRNGRGGFMLYSRRVNRWSSFIVSRSSGLRGVLKMDSITQNIELTTGDAEAKRAAIKAYFNATWTLYEQLF